MWEYIHSSIIERVYKEKKMADKKITALTDLGDSLAGMQTYFT